jgi:hypothetical protein
MKWCFDECLPPKWFRQFAEMLRKRAQPIDAIHLLEKFGEGMKDDAVSAWLVSQQPILLISGDSGQNTPKGDPRLHALCPALGIRSVFVSRKLCQRHGFDKVRMMMVCMPGLIEAHNGPAGARYRLECEPRNHDLYRIRPWPVHPD